MISEFKIKEKVIYKYIMPIITSNMFILLDGNKALVIDPHESEDAKTLLKSNHIEQCIIILTHEHYDHISGVNFFRELCPCVVYGNSKCQEMVEDPTKNLAAFFMAMFINRSEEERDAITKMAYLEYHCQIDEIFVDTMKLQFGELQLVLTETPGHSPGSICVNIDNKYYFTGDSLVDGNKVITRLPSGSRKDYNSVTKPYLEQINENAVIFPGHGQEGHFKNFILG